MSNPSPRRTRWTATQTTERPAVTSGGSRRRRGGMIAAALLATMWTMPAAACAAGHASVGFGEDGKGELGAGWKTPTPEEQPVAVLNMTGAVEISAGYKFGAARLEDGTVDTWGGNDFGQLGDGTAEESRSPTPVPGLSGVTQISTGGAAAMALLSSGRVMVWGSNQYGELGEGITAVPFSGRYPREVPGLRGVVQVSAGTGFDLALLSNGHVMAWGRNDDGEVGSGIRGPDVCEDAEIGQIGCEATPTEVITASGQPLSGVRQISAGGAAGYALLEDGRIMAWGDNKDGQLGTNGPSEAFAAEEVRLPRRRIAVAEVQAGQEHVLARLANGEVLGWGANANGPLGETSTSECQTGPCDPTPQFIRGLPRASAVSAGYGYSLAIAGGHIYAWGKNTTGALGTGNLASTPMPTPVAGTGPVVAISAGIQESFALLEGRLPMPSLVRLTPEREALRITWTTRPKELHLRYSVRGTGAWSPMVYPAEGTSSYVFAQLAGEEYEVEFNAEGKKRFLRATPLA